MAKHNLPKKFNTLNKKILVSNPWGLGKEISILFESIWPKIQELSNIYSDINTISYAISELPETAAFCKKVRLAHHYFVREVISIK